MASGDLRFEEQVTGTLTAGQRTSLASLLSTLWSGALGELTVVKFLRLPGGGVEYYLVGERTTAPGSAPIGCKILGRTP